MNIARSGQAAGHPTVRATNDATRPIGGDLTLPLESSLGRSLNENPSGIEFHALSDHRGDAGNAVAEGADVRYQREVDRHRRSIG